MTDRILAAALTALLVAPAIPAGAAEKAPPNVLLIVLDDQNAFAGRTDLAPEPVSPNLSRFAKTGVTFANAHCAAPVCNPSRTALLSGLRPSTTGIYDNNQDGLPANHMLTKATSLPASFREHSYKVAGGGKIFGSALGSGLKNRLWDESPERAAQKHDPLPPKDKLPLSGLPGKHDFGPSPATSRDQLEDWRHAGWAAEFLTKPQPKPFFLACGLVKPHTPWYVPKEYFELFPHARINIPDLAADEYAGVPNSARDKIPKTEPQVIARRKELVAAYLAASRYADDCVGRILAGLQKGPHAANTLVVICGDNGYEFGEKHNWSKGTLWEGSTHVPLVIAGPGIAQGRTSTRAVSLLDLYPTLLELAGMKALPGLEGVSVAALLKNPAAPWDRAVVTTAGFKNHAVRSERFRYIRYADGAEELYDHNRDPLERRNLASNAEFASVKDDLKKWLPKHDEPRNPNTSGRGDD
jgi:arylsulfatase A-like enzyme